MCGAFRLSTFERSVAPLKQGTGHRGQGTGLSQGTVAELLPGTALCPSPCPLPPVPCSSLSPFELLAQHVEVTALRRLDQPQHPLGAAHAYEVALAQRVAV